MKRRTVLKTCLKKYWRRGATGSLPLRVSLPSCTKNSSEFCLVIAQGEADVQEETQAADPLDEVKTLIAQGMDKKVALAQVAKARKVPKRELYNRLLDEE